MGFLLGKVERLVSETVGVLTGQQNNPKIGWCGYHDLAWRDRLHECMYEVCDPTYYEKNDDQPEERVVYEDGTSLPAGSPSVADSHTGRA